MSDCPVVLNVVIATQIVFQRALYKLIMAALSLAICTGLAEVALASGVQPDKAVNSRGTAGSHSKSGRQGASAGEVVFSTGSAGKNERRLKQPAYRSIRSTDASRALIDPAQLPAGYCSVVEHIASITLNPANSGNTNTLIPGTVAIPLGRHGGSFFTEIDVPGNSGYTPPERNIAEPVYYRISLMANDGNHYIITRQTPPRFKPGETVRFNEDGFLEKSDCVMHESGQIRPNQIRPNR